MGPGLKQCLLCLGRNQSRILLLHGSMLDTFIGRLSGMMKAWWVICFVKRIGFSISARFAMTLLLELWFKSVKPGIVVRFESQPNILPVLIYEAGCFRFCRLILREKMLHTFYAGARRQSSMR